MSLMRDNRPCLAHFLPRRRMSGHSSWTYMQADVLQKGMQMAAQDTLENNKRGSWRLKAELCLAAKHTLFTVRSKYWWNDGTKCYEVSKVNRTQPEADINVLVTSFQDHLCTERHQCIASVNQPVSWLHIGPCRLGSTTFSTKTPF